MSTYSCIYYRVLYVVYLTYSNIVFLFKCFCDNISEGSFLKMDLLLDANNNSSEKSYSLRPRAAARKDEDDSDREQEREDHGLRPSARKKKKSKQKPGKLSKYRRKTANARERSRMREINEAFEALRRAIPHLTPCTENNGEKLTKISTLRLAMKYITALSNALSDSPGESDAESFFSDYSLTTSDPREHSMTPSSISDHSDFYDQFFQKSLTGSISPCETVALTPSADLTFPIEDCEPSLKKSEAFSYLRTLSANISGVALDPLPPFYQVTSNMQSNVDMCKKISPSYQPLNIEVPEPILRSSIPSCEVQDTLPPSDIDSLLYPSLSFDELFIT